MASLLDAFNNAVQENKQTEPVDEALIEAGRSIAKAIDDISHSPDATATEKTKALYLTPHLVGILRELLATPAARKAVGLATADSKKASRLSLIRDQAGKKESHASSH